MLETIWNWIMENYPGMFAMLVVAAIVWTVSRWYFKFEARVKACEAHEPAIEEIRNDVKTLRKDIDSVKMDVKSIKDYLVGKDAKAVNILSMKQSPLVLNPLGKKVYEIIKGDKFINDNKDLLMGQLSHKNPRTALDVELSAKEVCLELLSNKIFDDIKNIVYNSPSIKIGADGKESDYIITIADVCFVLSIPLRDMYLEAHPEINTNGDK